MAGVKKNEMGANQRHLVCARNYSKKIFKKI
jgi:hypothetical protein